MAVGHQTLAGIVAVVAHGVVLAILASPQPATPAIVVGLSLLLLLLLVGFTVVVVAAAVRSEQPQLPTGPQRRGPTKPAVLIGQSGATLDDGRK